MAQSTPRSHARLFLRLPEPGGSHREPGEHQRTVAADILAHVTAAVAADANVKTWLERALATSDAGTPALERALAPVLTAETC